MQTILRGIRLMAMVVWVGGIIFFINVTQIAFSTLPTKHLAGIIVRGSLDRIHLFGIVCTIVFAIATFAQIYKRRGERNLVRSYSLSLVFLLPMLLCTLYSQYVIIPHMEQDRAEVVRILNPTPQVIGPIVPAKPVEVDDLPTDHPVRLDFERLHKQSTNVEGAVLLFGICILALIAREPHLTAQPRS
jgi:Domain of unknown function (DUF4149)